MASFPFLQFWSPFTLAIVFLTFALPALSKLHTFLIFYLNPFLSQVPKMHFFLSVFSYLIIKSVIWFLLSYDTSKQVPIKLEWLPIKNNFPLIIRISISNRCSHWLIFHCTYYDSIIKSSVLLLLKTEKHFPIERKSFSFSILSSDFSFCVFSYFGSDIWRHTVLYLFSYISNLSCPFRVLFPLSYLHDAYLPTAVYKFLKAEDMCASHSQQIIYTKSMDRITYKKKLESHLPYSNKKLKLTIST